MESAVSLSRCARLSVGHRWSRRPGITTPSPHGLRLRQSSLAVGPAGCVVGRGGHGGVGSRGGRDAPAAYAVAS